MGLLILYLSIAIFFSFLCSLLESMLLSVPHSYAVTLAKNNPRTGRRLDRLKRDIDRPLAAILSLNTIAHTVGAVGVGAESAKLFGSASVGVASAILTLLILVLSEIIPKTLGALYCRQLAPVGTFMIHWLIWFLYPLVLLSQKITQLLVGRRQPSMVSREELGALAEMGVKEGEVLESESRILQNVMRFSSLRAKDIMTPRSVLFTLPEDMTIGKIVDDMIELRFSRIPIHPLVGEGIDYYVLRSEVLLAAAHDEREKTLLQLGRKILVVPETVSLQRLFDNLLQRRELITLIVDEHGGVSGVVTMEDILETIVGIEVVDETDETADLQRLARQRWEKRARLLGLISD
ncbi:MAG: CNNM domain-containing protein [Thermodesulfobacteriota bacterium]|nr:CNNM domain-containing protein [Thermodesulfobacteriota bacterium]